MTLRLDLSRMLASSGIAGGIAHDAWTAAAGTAAKAQAVFDRRRSAGELGFLELPAATRLVAQVNAIVEAGRGKYDDVIALGIGGSGLGVIALRTALRPWGWNLLGADRRDGWPRLHVLDTPDPAAVSAVLDLVDLRRTLVLAISKSGGTAETMAQYLVVRDRLAKVHGERATDHLVFVTDPASGPLRTIAKADGIRALEVPPNVGGRFSVLTPVGTLPAALVGIDIEALLRGAGEMAARCTGGDLATNPALAYAMAQWLAHTTRGRGTHVFMPYRDALRDVALWFVQLWAESLGKTHADGRAVGPTPIAAVGPNDQHSQLQLFMEGTDDKTVTFVEVANTGEDVGIPALHPNIPEAAYLQGHGLGELVTVERRATAGGLAARGRPSATVLLDAVDPEHVGALFMWLQCATVYAGALYDVNPLDQPGVEVGKRYIGAQLGRPGTEAQKREYDALAPEGAFVI